MEIDGEKKIKLFCFPFAGGSGIFYHPWKKMLPSFIEMHPYELPGRGIRIGESLCPTIEEVVDDIMARVGDQLVDGHYALFGHSMGSLIVIELAKRIRLENLSPPALLFLSGKGAPQYRENPLNAHEFTDEDLRKYLVSLGGVEEDFFRHTDLVNLFLPVIRNDLRLVGLYRTDEVLPFETDIITLFGKNEEWTPQERMGWQEYTCGKFQQFTFPGGHFFIKDFFPEITRIIAQMLHHQLMC